jgi:Flp pilus assembly protein protease CpaA
MEALMAILFALIGLSGIPIIMIPTAFAIVSLFISIAVYDLRHTIIPDTWVWTLNVLALLWGLSPLLLLQSHDAWWWIILGGPAVAFPLFLLWAVSHGRWMGFGDVKLALSMGWLLGPMVGLYALMASFVIGALVSVGILLPLPYLMHALGITKKDDMHFSMKSEIPFGPFLIAATLCVWFALLYGIALPLMYTV